MKSPYDEPNPCDLWGVEEPAYAPESPRQAAFWWSIRPEYGNLLEMSLVVTDSAGVSAIVGAIGNGRPAWSPDGSSLAFSQASFLQVWRIGEQNVQVVTSEPMIADPAWSPDGALIAYTSLGDIRAVPPAGGESHLLVSSPGTDVQPAWSPIGDRLALASNREGSQGFDIWVQPLAGGAAVQLTHEPGDDLWPAWSPDGRFIAFASNRAGSFDIWVVPALGGNAVRLTNADTTDETAPTWSWDGRKIAFHTNDAEHCTGIGIQTDLHVIAVAPRTITDMKALYRGRR